MYQPPLNSWKPQFVVKATRKWYEDQQPLVFAFSEEMPSETHDTDHLIGKGYAAVKARKLAAALWGTAIDRVEVEIQICSIGNTAAAQLSPGHAVVWSVTGHVPESTYAVLRPICTVSRFGDRVYVTFVDGDRAEYRFSEPVCSVSHLCWDLSLPVMEMSQAFVRFIESSTVAPSGRHPCTDEVKEIESYCSVHDLFNCWYCQPAAPPLTMVVTERMPPPPPPPPPLPIR